MRPAAPRRSASCAVDPFCHFMSQVAERLDGKVRVVKVDVDENPDLSAMLKVGEGRGREG